MDAHAEGKMASNKHARTLEDLSAPLGEVCMEMTIVKVSEHTKSITKTTQPAHHSLDSTQQPAFYIVAESSGACLSGQTAGLQAALGLLLRHSRIMQPGRE